MLVQLINGLAFGVLILIVSSGLALIFGLRNVVNFAHGAIYMLAAYVAYSVSGWATFWGALLIVPLIFFVLGMIADRFTIRPLEERSPLDMVLLTFGLTYVLSYVVEAVWGKASRTIEPPSGLAGTTSFLGITYPTYRLFIIAVGIAVCAALILLLRYSQLGLHVRASSVDRTTAAAMGINVDRVGSVVVGLGLALAGLAGVLAGPYLTLSPHMGNEILILTFVVVVVGGLGSISGSMIAAIVLGLGNALASVQWPSLAAYVPYLLMLLVLLFRPQGIAGNRTAL